MNEETMLCMHGPLRNVVFCTLILVFLVGYGCSKRNSKKIDKIKKEASLRSCSLNLDSQRHVHQHLSRHPRDTTTVKRADKNYGKAVYFSGREILKLKRKGKFSRVEIPNGKFTVSLWVKPEGGQFDPVTIIGKYEKKSILTVICLSIRVIIYIPSFLTFFT